MAPWTPNMSSPDVVWNTDLGAYDQVIALTQYMVNESFRNMWKKVEKVPDHPLRRFQYKHKRFGNIDAQLDAPLVMFNVENAAFNELVYVIRFIGGEANLFVNANDEDTKNFKMAGFQYAFKVEIGQDAVKAGTKKHEEITGQLPRAGGPGDYSVSRLLIDFTKAKASNPVEHLSEFNIPAWTESSDLRAGFKMLMAQYLDKRIGDDSSTMGFVATNNNPALVNSHAPTFVPTSCSFQTYPYFNRKAIGDALGVGKNGLNDTSRLNYFCYREMTGGDDPPKDSTLINLPIRGIWTNDRLDARGVPIDRGTFMISRKNFWDGYLLPLLKEYNAQMEVICGRPSVTVKLSGFGLDWTWSCGWSIGKKPDRIYDWTPTANKTAWYYSSFEGENQNKRERLKGDQINAYFKEDWAGWLSYNYCRSRTKSWCDTEVSFQPGSNTFVMKGESGLHFWLQLEDWKALYETDDFKYVCKWQIDFTMMSVKDGGLEIKVKAQEPVLEESPNNKFELAKYKEGSLGPALDYARKYFKQSLTNLTSLASNLTKAFNNQNKFFFPGSGSYFFEDPTFNHNGDMFCRISYNMAQDAPERADITVTSQNLPNNPPTSFAGSKPDPEAVKNAEEEKAKGK